MMMRFGGAAESEVAAASATASDLKREIMEGSIFRVI
jgi:hypothetical protein